MSHNSYRYSDMDWGYDLPDEDPDDTKENLNFD